MGVSSRVLGAESMTEERDPFVVMSWTVESCVFESGEPDDFIYETSGDLLSVDADDARSLVGKFRIYYVDVGRAVDEGMPVFDVFDSYSHTVGYYDAIFGAKSPDFSDRLMKLLNYDVVGSNVLILDRLEVLPQYRRRGVGLRIMRNMMKRFGGGAAVVAIKPFPLQFEVEPSNEDERKWRTELGLGQLPKNEPVATKKLRDYYGRLGFLRVSRTPFMVRATAWAMPEAQGV